MNKQQKQENNATQKNSTITSEGKSLWGEPERVHGNMKQNIQATESTYAQHN